MLPDELTASFGLPGVLSFDSHEGLTRAQVTLPTCRATVYLHGAQLTDWQPVGQPPVLFLSDRSAFAADKAIRGGIPICWPWFGARLGACGNAQPGPAHGFARLSEWELAFAALLPGDEPTLRLSFTLAPSELSRSFGFASFRVALEMILGEDGGRRLTLRLSVANPGPEPLRFEEALHAYFRVANVGMASITGLEGAQYLDKTDDSKPKQAPTSPLQLTAETDRVFPSNMVPLTLHDGPRAVTLRKGSSATTIVWNPWAKGAAKLADLAPEAWPHFLCMEAGNTGSDAITLAPGDAHTMEAVITAEALPAAG